MSIMWKYLDKRSATIAAIKDYDSMKFIIANTGDDIKAEQERMIGLGSPKIDGLPYAKNNQAGEDRIVNGLEEIDIMKERYRQALEYMEWFQPAWNQLSEDEKFVLETFYSEDNSYGSNTAYFIAKHYNIEQASAYRKKNRALEHLVVLLFGKG